MGLKLLWPLAGFTGVVGSIAGVSGFSIFSLRSQKSANTKPTHKWSNIALPSKISAKLNCGGEVWNPRPTNQGGGYFEQVKADVNWDLDLDSKDGELLKKKGEILKEIKDFSITREGSNDGKLWPILNRDNTNYENLRVWVYPEQKSLQIKMNSFRTPSTSYGGVYYSSQIYDLAKKFSCSIDSSQILKNGDGGGIIFGQDKQVWQNRHRRINTTEKLYVSIALGDCKIGEGKQNLQCPLKVISKNSFDWSKNVDQVATVTFSQ